MLLSDLPLGKWTWRPCHKLRAGRWVSAKTCIFLGFIGGRFNAGFYLSFLRLLFPMANWYRWWFNHRKWWFNHHKWWFNHHRWSKLHLAIIFFFFTVIDGDLTIINWDILGMYNHQYIYIIIYIIQSSNNLQDIQCWYLLKLLL